MSAPPTRRAARAAQQQGTPRRDASMSLLLQTMQEPLDPGYARAAARRATGFRPRLRTRLVVAGCSAVVGGLVLTEAVQQLRTPEPSETRARQLLEQELTERTERLDALEVRAGALREDVAREQERLSGPADDPLAALGAAAGELPVRGEGIELVVDDTPQDGAQEQGERLLDRDLQRLVNGVWAAGATAVAVDGQRLTGLTAIRSAGDAVLVGFRPLVPPYVVQAVGDASALQAGFAEGAGGRYAQVLQEEYGIRTSLRALDEVEVPAAASTELRVARPVGPTGLPSPEPSAGGRSTS